jgi:transcriptional regulator with XRE-family HTH domain
MGAFKAKSTGSRAMKILDVFGDNVRKFRTERHMSQDAFATKCGLHRTYISAVERHKRSISLNNIQKIADALEVDTYMLFIEPDMEVSVKRK